MEAPELGNVIEALVFAANEPVSAAQISQIFGSVTGVEAAPEEAVIAIQKLNERYKREGSAFTIEAWGGGYRLATQPDFAPFIRALMHEERTRRLSSSSLEALAVVAYRQPVTKAEIDFVRGVDSDHSLKRLLEYGLVDVIGRSESLGRPLLYGTTAQFLNVFGFSSLESLPRLREIEELLDDPNFDKERARLLALGGLLEGEAPRESPPQEGINE